MASLRSYLPPAGSTVWRNERRLTRTSSSGDVDSGLSRTRIKHIVIREVWKRDLPSPHALYKIDVMTQSNHWFILRRYREFHSLHINLVKQYHIPTDMLPTKKLFSNMSLTHLEKRRNALEHYLQRLINSHHDIAESEELFQFLNVQTHDVLCVTRQLAKVLENEGRSILASGGVFTFSPTQMYCITRQLRLPHVVIEQSDTSHPGEEVVDLGYLYGFIQELKNLCVSGVASRLSPCQELISNQAFDISLFKSLEKLQIEKCHISVIDGLFRIQKQMTHVTLKNCLKSMKEFLVDAAMQKRAIKQAASNVESWRNMSTTKLTDNRVVVRPWIFLTHVNMSHNNISTFDHSLKLLPSLEQLDLSHNEFVHLDLEQLTSSTLTFLNLSHNNIHYVSATSRDLRNLKSLLLTNNKLQSLEGVDCLRGLVELDVRHNQIRAVEELVKISSLLHLRILALTGNPCVALKSYRISVFCQIKARELILDGIKITESEKAKVLLAQGRKVSSTDVGQSHKPDTIAQTKVNQDMRRKVTPYRDDDQDSGFGGNYTGSIDEGGLVFDWSCYNNRMDTTSNSFPYHATGPSTSKTLLRNPPAAVNVSSSVCQGNSSSSNEIAVTETRRSNNADTSSLQSYAKANPSDGNTFPDSINYRGKQPANKQNVKRNIKSCSSPSSTLLQLSLNDSSCKENKTTAKDGLNLMNKTHTIKDNTKLTLQSTFPNKTNSSQTNTNSIHNRTNSVDNDSTNVQVRTSSGEDGANSNNDYAISIKSATQHEFCSEQHKTYSVQENTNSGQDNTSSVQDDTSSVQDDTSSVQDDTSSVQDGTNSVQDDTNSAQDDTSSVQDNTSSVQDDTSSVQDDTSSVQDDTSSVQDGTNSVQDDTNSAQEKTVKHSTKVQVCTSFGRDSTNSTNDHANSTNSATQHEFRSEEHKTNSVPENTNSVQESANSAHEKTVSVQGNATSVQDGANSVQDVTNYAQGDTNSVEETTIFVQKNTISAQDDTTCVKDSENSVHEENPGSCSNVENIT